MQQYWIYWHRKTSREEETGPQEETQRLFLSPRTRVLYFNVGNTGLKLGAVPVHRIFLYEGQTKTRQLWTVLKCPLCPWPGPGYDTRCLFGVSCWSFQSLDPFLINHAGLRDDPDMLVSYYLCNYTRGWDIVMEDCCLTSTTYYSPIRHFPGRKGHLYRPPHAGSLQTQTRLIPFQRPGGMFQGLYLSELLQPYTGAGAQRPANHFPLDVMSPGSETQVTHFDSVIYLPTKMWTNLPINSCNSFYSHHS